MYIDNPKIIRAWSFYDWANSVYSLVISSTIFPIYYAIITTVKNSDQRLKIDFFGISLEPDAIYNYSLSLSFLIVILISPILSSIADTTGSRKKFLIFFCLLGSFSTCSLFFFKDFNQIYFGLAMSVLSSVGFWGSLVFYNSYLPDIVSKEKQDSTSAQGYIFGYIGSVILLVTSLIIIQVLGKENPGFYTRLVFLIVGIWWILFAQYTFYYLPDNKARTNKTKNIITSSFKELFIISKNLFKDSNLKNFLLSFFLYSVGMQTLFLMATLFGKNEIRLADDKLILTILLLQIEAIIGAFIFSKFSSKYGNKKMLIIGVFLWIIACFYGYSLNKENPNVEYHFYGVASLVGLVMGGLQSLSRSSYSKIIPETKDTTIYFSFYDIFEKMAIVLGTFVYGFAIQITGNMRISILSMGIFFVFSLIFLFRLKNKTA